MVILQYFVEPFIRLWDDSGAKETFFSPLALSPALVGHKHHITQHSCTCVVGYGTLLSLPYPTLIHSVA